MNVSALHPVHFPDFVSSERVILKRHVETLAKLMFEAIDEDRTRLGSYLPWVTFTQSEKDTLNYLQMADDAWERHERFDYGLFRKSDGQYLGNVGVHMISWTHRKCEMGYWLTSKGEGEGYVSEAVVTLEQHLFSIGFHRIEVRCSTENERSARVPERCGYQLEGTFTEDAIENGHYRSTRIFAKINPVK